MNLRHSTLTELSAKNALVSAAHSVGVREGAVELLGPVADNAVFRLAPGVVGKVALAEAFNRAEREVLAGRWLLAQGVSAVRPLDVAQPVHLPSHVVTLWQEVVGRMASTADLGELLKALHGVGRPHAFDLRSIDPFVRVDERISQGGHSLQPADSQFLVRHEGRLRADFAEMSRDMPAVIIHGDPNRKNAIRATDGRTVLLDLERLGLGPREWDLVVPAVYHRLGWYSDAEYDEFVDAYGWDVRTSDSFELLAAIRELRMTSWLIARLPREPGLKAEAERRIASLRDPSAPRQWTPGE